MSSAVRRLHMAFHQWRWICGGHRLFPSWSSLGTSWTGWMRVSIADGHLLLSWRTPLDDCSRGLHCWSAQIVPEWLEPILHLCWSFWGPATDLHARLCQTPYWSTWSYGKDRVGVVGASLWWLDYWRSVLPYLLMNCVWLWYVRFRVWLCVKYQTNVLGEGWRWSLVFSIKRTCWERDGGKGSGERAGGEGWR